MKNFSNFCGIFATLFVTTTMVLLASCSQDDDYYDSDMYTLAETGTRLSESEETLPSYSRVADMGSVLVNFKNTMGHIVLSTNVHLRILATTDMTQFNAHVEVNPKDGEFNTATVTKQSEDSINYVFKVKINIFDRYENKLKGTIEQSCPKSSFN